MDYVVAGFGIGAILALIGFALWELFGESEEPGQGWLTRTAIGLMIGALVIWAITGVSLVSTIDDSTGSHLVLLTTLVTLAAIAAGSFWYWRADQALLASMPRQQRPQTSKKESTGAAVVAAPAGVNDIELSEWDSWPERQERSADAGSGAEVTVAEVAFEPEVAAEPIPQAEVPAEETEDAEAVEAAADVEVAESTSVVATVDDAIEQVEVEASGTDEAGETEPAEPEVAAEPPAEPEPPVELPHNVRPIRPAARAESPVVESVDEPKDVELPEPPAPAVAEDVVVAEETVEFVESEPVVVEAPAAFESSILADIDVTKVEREGRYRSPLLADLEQNPDELEGVGLAKWRPDARLTAEDQNEPPSPKPRRRR